MNYFKRFFDEKELDYVTWDINGHIIDNEFVIDYLINLQEVGLRRKIKTQLKKIDFMNGDINNFLKYLAEFIIND